MRKFKRYANRKLYDMDQGEYVTLPMLANLIHQGEEVSVIDNASGEDITSVILTQIILEQEKLNGGLLPISLLRTMIKVGRNSLKSVPKNILPANELIQTLTNKVDGVLFDLVERGEIAESNVKRISEDILNQIQRSRIFNWINELDRIDLYTNLDIPTREDYLDLVEQIDKLSEKISSFAKKSQ